MNFEELSKKFKKIGKDTVTEVQKLNEIRQLNGRVNEEKKALNQIYMEMGKKLYELYKDAPLEGFEAEMQSVEEKFSMIDLLQDQIRGVKGVALCPNCNMEVGAGERFCSNCGEKMPEVIEIEEKEDDVIMEQAEEAADDVVEAAEESADDVVEAAEEVVDCVEAAEEVVEDVTEVVEEAVEDAVEAAEEVAEEAKEAAEEVVEDVKEAAEEIVEDETEAEE